MLSAFELLQGVFCYIFTMFNIWSWFKKEISGNGFQQPLWLFLSIIAFRPLTLQSFRPFFRTCSTFFFYLDDILIFSKLHEEHVHHVQSVLQCPLEWQFNAASVCFLGYIITLGSIQMDPAKIFTVTSWPIPKSHKQLQRFRAFANLLSSNYSFVVPLLTDLTSSRVSFQVNKWAFQFPSLW